MNTADLLNSLALECPNGVSFEPLAVRLLRKKIPLDSRQIEDLKATMFQLGSGLWFSHAMILKDDFLFDLKKRAIDWLTEYGCFSVAQLFEEFRTTLRHIETLNDCAVFLQHLEFKVSTLAGGEYFCIASPDGLGDALAAIAKQINSWLEEVDGTLTFQEILQRIPNLSAKALEILRTQFLPEVHKVEIGGVTCWCNAEAIALPDDFSEKITSIAETLDAIKEKISISKLEFALNLFYRTRFREEYSLLDNDTFMRVCAMNYKGENNIFPNFNNRHTQINDSSVLTKRVRAPNTRFGNLGIPIGSELVFVKDNSITCTVLDDVNHVEYAGNSWIISTLAMHLLDVSPANGFCFFSYNGEILWDRRLRLEREEIQFSEETSIREDQGANEEIIGLSGKAILASTWQSFKRDGTDPRVEDWVQRVEKGETLEQIANESEYALPTVKVMISNYRLYYKVCKLNGIAPEGARNV